MLSHTSATAAAIRAGQGTHQLREKEHGEHTMKTATANGRITVVDQTPVLIPDLTIKDLLSAIP